MHRAARAAVLAAGFAATWTNAGVAAAPAFAVKPTATRSDGGARIEFTVTASTDVAVWVEDAEGRVVRHLLAGALGDHPPAPLKPGLRQSLAWDGNDDNGRPAAGGPFTVKVGLGLRHVLDRIIGWDPRSIQKIYSVAVGPRGEVYVLWAQPETVAGPPQVAVVSREGKYLRTIVPCPADLLPDRMAGINPLRLADGQVVPRVHHALACTFYPWLSGTCRQTMTVTSAGRLVMTTGHFNYSTAGSMGPRRLLSVNLDGTCPDAFAGPVLDKRLWGGRPVMGYAHVAAAPDGNTVYVSGLYDCNDWAKEKVPAHVVLKARLSDGPGGEAAVFFGERAVAGADERHLNDPRGVAVDAQGNLYVADYGNDRIVRLDQAGRFTGQISMEKPDQIVVNRKTGAIYAVSVDHGEHGPWNIRGWQNKKVLKVKSWAEPDVAATLDAFKDLNALTIAVDQEAAPPVLWVARAFPSTYHGAGRGLFRCVDLGDAFSTPECVLGPEAGPAGLATCWYVTANPLNEQIHVRADKANSARAWWAFDGRTGERLKAPAVRPIGQERAFDRQGRLYCNDSTSAAEKGNVLARFTPEGQPAAFSGTGDHLAERMPGFMKAGPRGFCVAPSGDVYVLHYPGSPWKPEGSRTTLTVVGPDGKVKREGVVTSLRTAASVRVDRAGNVYLAENIKDSREPIPAELGVTPTPGGRVWSQHYDHAAWYPWMYGSIVKFGAEGGRIERAKGGEYLTGWPRWHKDGDAVAVHGAKWVRLGMAPVPAEDQTCVCDAGRFDLDAFDRLYVPDAGRCRVTVFDTEGNELGHFGGYGNMDSAGPGSAVPVPSTPLAWPACVAVSREAVYVADWLNPRVVRVRPAYAVEAACQVLEP